MEGEVSSAVVAPPPQTRHGSGGSIYEKYLNIKNNVLPNDRDAASVNKLVEISNSTDQHELEAGEVVRTEDIKVACATGPSGNGVSAAPAEPQMEPQAHFELQQARVDTLQLGASGSLSSAGDSTQLTAVGTSCASTAAFTVNASTTAPTIADDPSSTAPMSLSAAAFEHPRASALSSPLHLLSNEQYASKQVGGPRRMTNNAMSPRMGGPGGPLRGRSRSRDRDGMPGGGRPRSPPCGPRENGRFDNLAFSDNGPPRGPPDSPRGGFDGRPDSFRRNDFNGRPSSPRRNGFSDRPSSPLRGDFNERLGSSPRSGFNRRFNSPPRGSFDGRPGSSPQRGFNGRFDSPPRGSFNGRPGSPPRNGFDRGRSSPRRDELNGPPGNGPRGRSPPCDDFRRGPPRSPERGPPMDFWNGPIPGQGSPRGGMMGGRGPRRSRSPLRGPPRSPPRNSFEPRRGPYSRSPSRGDERRREMLPMGRLPSPMRGCGSGPRFDDRSHSGPEPPLGRDGPSNMFFARSRSRSPNRPPPDDIMRKRDRSWERGDPSAYMTRRPFDAPGSMPDSPRSMEPHPLNVASEWNFDLKRSGKIKCRCSATSLSVGLDRQLPLYLDVVMLPHLSKSPEFLQLERPNVRRVVYELKPESMADASGYQEFVDYLIQGRSGHARAGVAVEMDSQGFKVFILPPGQAARQLGYKGDHMVAVLRSR